MSVRRRPVEKFYTLCLINEIRNQKHRPPTDCADSTSTRMPILCHEIECKRSNDTFWMLNAASHYTTAHSNLPVTDVIRTVVEEVQQAATSEYDDSVIVSGRSTLESVSDALAQSREALDRVIRDCSSVLTTVLECLTSDGLDV